MKTYPEDRIELLKRISPPTPDVSYPVDLFVRKPAQIWNMPVERPFGKWNVLAVFNYTGKTPREGFTYTTPATRDLIAKFTVRSGCGEGPPPRSGQRVHRLRILEQETDRDIQGDLRHRVRCVPYDCDIYSIVEKQNRPVLISTSRHIRQMAFDIKDLAYDGRAADAARRFPRGGRRSVSVAHLRSGGIRGKARGAVRRPDGEDGRRTGPLLTVDYTASTGKDVEWKVFFE